MQFCLLFQSTPLKIIECDFFHCNIYSRASINLFNWQKYNSVYFYRIKDKFKTVIKFAQLIL